MLMAYMPDNYIERILNFISYHHGKRFTISVICTLFIYYFTTVYDYMIYRAYPQREYLWISHFLIYVFLAWIIISGIYVRGDKRYVTG